MEIKKYFVLSSLLLTPKLFAHDHLNLEHGVPLEVEDAYVTAYQNREFHTYMFYERLSGSVDKFVVVPRLECGLFRNFQLELSSPFEMGDNVKKKSSNLEVSGLYSFNMETLHIPGISLGGGVIMPTGKGRDGYDTQIKLNLTKTLPIPISFHRLHVNINWTQNAKAHTSERDNAFKYILGYQFRLGTDDFLIADYFLEEEMEKDKESQMIELGLRHQFNPLTVIAVGAGAGLTDKSPDFRGNFSFQRALNLFD